MCHNTVTYRRYILPPIFRSQPKNAYIMRKNACNAYVDKIDFSSII